MPTMGTSPQVGPSRRLSGRMTLRPAGSSRARLPSPMSSRLRCGNMCSVLMLPSVWSSRPPSAPSATMAYARPSPCRPWLPPGPAPPPSPSPAPAPAPAGSPPAPPCSSPSVYLTHLVRSVVSWSADRSTTGTPWPA
jgi:hypothetical protein